ncbi:MAG: DUF2157 domain-containing protein [Verrucomicrobiia bacterium]
MNEKYVKWLLNELPNLVSNGVISAESAEKLRQHYSSIEFEKDRTKKNAIVLFSIIGSALIGGGIILLLAHNWQQISRPLRTIISIIPLLLIQILGIRLILKNNMTTAWREGIGTFQTLALGAALALVSQTYNLGGTVEEFLLTWALLSLPLAYILRTSFTILLYLLSVIVWTITVWDSQFQKFLFYPLLALSLPFLYITIREKNKYHQRPLLFLAGFTMVFFIGTFSILHNEIKQYPIEYGIYLLVFATIFLVGMRWYNESKSITGSPIQTIGILGILITSIILNFADFWEHLYSRYGGYHLSFVGKSAPHSLEIGTCIIFLLAYVILWGECILKKLWTEVILGTAPLVFVIAYLLVTDKNTFLPSVVFTLYLVVIGVTILVRALQQRKLAFVNFGMLIISTAIIIKFLEANISFVARGLAFIIAGVIFLAINLLLKRWKGDGQ